MIALLDTKKEKKKKKNQKTLQHKSNYSLQEWGILRDCMMGDRSALTALVQVNVLIWGGVKNCGNITHENPQSYFACGVSALV